MRWLSCLAVLILVLAPSRAASASAFPRFDGLWLPVGVSLGGVVAQEGSDGFVLGGELSVVELDYVSSPVKWMLLGGVADATWDFGHDVMRLSGPLRA